MVFNSVWILWSDTLIILFACSDLYAVFSYILSFTNIIITWVYTYPFNSTVFFGLKFLICIGFLILIRGGTPRYRYDYLTKLGWLKFLGFSLSILCWLIFWYQIL